MKFTLYIFFTSKFIIYYFIYHYSFIFTCIYNFKVMKFTKLKIFLYFILDYNFEFTELFNFFRGWLWCTHFFLKNDFYTNIRLRFWVQKNS